MKKVRTIRRLHNNVSRSSKPHEDPTVPEATASINHIAYLRNLTFTPQSYIPVMLLVLGLIAAASIISVTGKIGATLKDGAETLSSNPSLYTFKIVKSYPHDGNAFTQGLLFYGNSTLYESTGLYGRSSVREVELTTGKVRRQTKNSGAIFGEGLALYGESLLQIAWRTQQGFVYNRKTLSRSGTFSHPMTDGWGLTRNGSSLVGSDGTSKLYFLKPQTFKKISEVLVKDNGREIVNLNELEVIKGKVWANVWLTDCIAIISMQSGKVTGWLHAPQLRIAAMKAANGAEIDVLNGIAYDSKKDRIFVTGKLWPRLYEIKLVQIKNPNASQLQSVREKCIN